MLKQKIFTVEQAKKNNLVLDVIIYESRIQTIKRLNWLDKAPLEKFT
jgi:hypothetical protein